MRQKKIDLVITGADRISRKGYVANKVGTYNLALIAKFHNIPFYIAAPTNTIDFETDGEEIIIEERDPSEITEFCGVRIAVEGVKVYSPAFDITPPEFISAIVTDSGVVYPPYEDSLKFTFSVKDGE